jgi:undecaprenyl-diphosphatase
MKRYRKTWFISLIDEIGKKQLIICGVILLGFIVLAWQVVTQQLNAFDESFLKWLQETIPKTLLPFFKFFYFIGNAESSALVVLVGLGVLCWKRYWKEAQALAFASLGILILIDQILKPLFGRIRPAPGLVEVDGKSFPSGHASGNFVLYFYLAFILSAQFPNLTPYLYGIATTLLLVMGVSSLYLNVHWLTDLIGAYCVGFIWLTISLALLKILDKKYS